MNDDVRLAMKGFELVGPDHRLIDLTGSTARIQSYQSDPYLLMKSMSVFNGAIQKLVFLDMPRASSRAKAKLIGYSSNDSVEWSEVSQSDLDYRFRLKANCLISAKLAIDCLAPDGVMLAVATPDTYMAVRGAIEHWIGPDKFIGEIVYQIRSGGGNDSKWLSIEHETILIFSRNPELVSGFRLERTHEELAKFSEKDEQGPFYWDTYIRKQARQFYPIKCPDGTILKVDEDGKPISWLWSHETFKVKLKDGEVKFEKIQNKGWRLFYKARLTEFGKILRSIVNNQCPLNDFIDGAEEGKAGEIFLTSRGSDEIKGYTGEGAPAFLKSSEYYKFVISTFSKDGAIYFPFNENCSALIAGLSEDFKNRKIIIGGALYSEDFARWRTENYNKSGNKTQWVLTSGNIIDLLNLQELDDDLKFRIIKSKCPGVFKWHDICTDDVDLAIGGPDASVVIIRKIKTHEKSLDLMRLLEDKGFSSIFLTRVITHYSTKLVSGIFMIPDQVNIEQFPINFLK